MTIHPIHQSKEPNHRAYSSNQRNVLIALSITAIVMIAEIIGGLLANGMGIMLLRKSAHTSLNVKSAFFHIVGDTISSGSIINKELNTARSSLNANPVETICCRIMPTANPDRKTNGY
jgi:Co/Zn/Cd efflux system component